MAEADNAFLLRRQKWEAYDEAKQLFAIDSNAKNEYQWTGLIYLVKAGDNFANSIKVRIQAGSDFNAITIDGSTALHYAVLWNCPKIIHLLILAGADPNKQNEKDDNKVPLDYAPESSKTNIITVIEKAKQERKQNVQRVSLKIKQCDVVPAVICDIIADYALLINIDETTVGAIGKTVTKMAVGVLKLTGAAIILGGCNVLLKILR